MSDRKKLLVIVTTAIFALALVIGAFIGSAALARWFVWGTL